MSAGFGSRMSLGVRLSLLSRLHGGGLADRRIDLQQGHRRAFRQLDHMAMSAKLAVFRDELRGLGSEQQMRRREAELLANWHAIPTSACA